MVNHEELENILQHYGTPRHSGRYPWGSGENPYQSGDSFLSNVAGLKKQGLSDTEIAEGLGITTTQLRAYRSIAKSEKRAADAAMVRRLSEKGMSNVAIGERMGINESSVRALKDPYSKAKNDVLMTTADMLKEQVDKHRFVDIGSGVENHIGVSQTKLSTAVAILQEKGYKVQYLKVKQLGTGNFTTVKVLVPADTPYSELIKNQDKIHTINAYTEDRGRTYLGIEDPVAVSSKRVGVRYAEEGGNQMDGVIQLRPGVKDISLGNAKYAQVRIAVDGTHYLKGMAVYSNDLPDGVDLMFNTNKSDTGNKLDAMKSLKDDKDNPFGSVIRQNHYTDSQGKEQLSPINIVGSPTRPGSGEEGAWSDWSRALSSQVLSKQTPALAKRQLGFAYDSRKAEFDEINSLTNPAIKKKLLDSFADECESSSEYLKAAALPRQSNHVLLPIPGMKDNEVYAPNYRNGETVVLIRHPHGGTFEIPELTVNNRHKEAKEILGNAVDAVGINANVAARLSGADFDGDTVLVIPNGTGAIKTSPALKALKDFDPISAYPAYEGMIPIKPETKQKKMGDVSNLITDMTIKGASQDEIARAVRHSMVVIDAEKHNLNYKQSYVDNGIAQLKEKYQGAANAGASTLISLARSEARVPDRKPRPASEGGPVNLETGAKEFVPTGETYVNKSGKEIVKTVKTTKMAVAKDASTLSSGSVMESIYADHANRLKALANKARLESVKTPSQKYSPSAATTYATEVASLNSKLNIALKNRPIERKAQILANAVVNAKLAANPHLEAAEIKKLNNQALMEMRSRTGAKKQLIDITDTEWHAIQSGAVSHNKLMTILSNTDVDALKQRAMPRTRVALTSGKLSRAKGMLAAGYTQAEIADALGISTSTLNNALK